MTNDSRPGITQYKHQNIKRSIKGHQYNGIDFRNSLIYKPTIYMKEQTSNVVKIEMTVLDEQCGCIDQILKNIDL